MYVKWLEKYKVLYKWKVLVLIIICPWSILISPYEQIVAWNLETWPGIWTLVNLQSSSSFLALYVAAAVDGLKRESINFMI